MKTEQNAMTVIEAIYARRSVRSYSDIPVEREALMALLAAAVQAPTAIDEEPWAFSVIQDRAILLRLSEDAMKVFCQQIAAAPAGTVPNPPHASPDDAQNLFHDAGTLVVIWAKPTGRFVEADCWLAAENLMLAACALGLGTCVIGSAVGGLNQTRWKTELGIPLDWLAIAPIIVGIPTLENLSKAHKPAEIASWR